MTHDLWPWLGLLGLGAYHGLNPGMGWLFAVALALQEKSRYAIYRALLPIALGHALSTGFVVLLIGVIGVVVPHGIVRVLAASALIAFGVYRLVRGRHPKWVGMRVGWRDLILWSFLMASAHGAGLMLLPVLLGRSAAPDTLHAHHAPAVSQTGSSQPMAFFDNMAVGTLSVGVHTVGYLLVMGLVALVVYEKLGLALLRHAWFNLDLLWAGALVAAGTLTLFL
ncbi:MAG: hypothetical protein EHM35_14995 [Planctomycetaceae bacterium]|nr:MAG: hypothetical protein EHM35_14995 [Planctomycetaceae bacterium]